MSPAGTPRASEKRASEKRASEKKPRKFWFDPRFAIGLLLIVASVGGVVAVVATADATVKVLAARSAFVPGSRIDAADLIATDVRLDDADSLYLLDGDVPEDGLVVTKAVSAGELVPASAVGATAGLTLTSLVIEVGGQLSASIEPGSVVDVWASRKAEGGAYGPPTVVVSSATVVRIIESEGMVVDSSTASVEILIPRTRIARVLEAVANDDSLSVVAVSLPGKR